MSFTSPNYDDITFALLSGKEYRRNKLKTLPTLELAAMPKIAPPKQVLCETFQPRQRKRKIKNTFLGRVQLNHKEYLDLLSTPGARYSSKPLATRRRVVTTKIISPRLMEISTPKRLRTLHVWRQFGNVLPLEAVVRLKNLLFTKNKMTVKEASDYFRYRDKKKPKAAKRRDQWLKEQVDQTVNVIMDYLLTRPDLELNFKQMLISDAVITKLRTQTRRKLPQSRHSEKYFDQEFVKIVDKISFWIDYVSLMVDLKNSEKEVIEESFVSTPMMGDDESYEGDGGPRPATSLQELIKTLADVPSEFLMEQPDNMVYSTRYEILKRMQELEEEYEGYFSPTEVMKEILIDWLLASGCKKLDTHTSRKIEQVAEQLAAMWVAENAVGNDSQPSKSTKS